MFFFFFFSFFFTILLGIFTFFLGFSSLFSGVEKGSPFECGFFPFSSLGSSFSMPFFVISLMFLLFDVEILVVCFYPFFCSSSFVFFVSSYVIIFIIFFSTLYEWMKGILSWV